MPTGSRYLQASPSLTLEFVTIPKDYLRKPVLKLIFQFNWPFLEPPSITLLCVTAPVISCYRKLSDESISLTTAEVHRISTPLDHRTSTPSICTRRTRNVTKLMPLCDFRLGGMIRCLDRVYTSDFLVFASTDACLIDLSDIPVNPGEPPHNFPALQYLSHQHIPLKSLF